MKLEKKDNSIKSIVKAFSIIELIMKNHGPMSLSEIARNLDMARSTVHGLAATLLDIDVLAQDIKGHYELGNKLYEIGGAVSVRWIEKAIAKPYITKLVEDLKETVHLAKLVDGQVLYIDKQDSSHSIRIVTEPGLKLPAHSTGVGKVLLAYLSSNELESILKQHPLEYYTDNTIIDNTLLKEALKKIREDGYGTDNQEFIIGLSCLAVPIFDHLNHVIAALSISMPVSRFNDESKIIIKDALLKASKEISIQLKSTYYD